MAKWIFGVGKAAVLGWAEALASSANAAHAKKPSVPKGCAPSVRSPRFV